MSDLSLYHLQAGFSDLNATAGTNPGTARFVIPFGGDGVVISRRVVLDGAITTTAAVLGTAKNGTAVTGNGLTIAVSGSAADAVYGGALAVPISVSAGDTVQVTTTQAAGSAMTARCIITIKR